jgi:VWFA-related protein
MPRSSTANAVDSLRRIALVAGVALAASVGPRAQAPAPSRQQPPPAGPTFRIATELATIDAVVVDKDGRHVTDLTPADFEIVERGKRQMVRQAVYVRVVNPDGAVQPQPAPLAPATAPGDVGAAPATTRSRPIATSDPAAGAGRVIAIVVDDLGLSLASGSIPYTRQMLTRYVDEYLATRDSVAILRTSGGAGALQQFTTDRRLLHAAIDRVRFSFLSRPGLASFDAVPPAGSGSLDIEKLRDELISVGTLGALEYVIRGIEPLPGRKSVVFVSEGFDLGFRERKTSHVYSAFQRVMDRANRAGVVVYTIDPRGLQTGGLTAADGSVANPSARPFEPAIGATSVDPPPFSELMRRENRMRTLTDTQESLLYLAEQTGGFAVVNSNDLTAGLMRAIDDTKGYYLIGFDTAIEPNEPWDPGDIRIRVRRPGLGVRARRGLFGPADRHDRPRATEPTDPLVAATLSPFASGAIDVRLTTLFAHDEKVGSYVRTLFFIDPAGLTFVDGPDGRHHADLSLLLLAIDEQGQAVGQVRLQVPLRLDDVAYGELRQRGLLYTARVAIKDPGGYQIRTAVKDDRSGATGTSAQFVEVPNVGRGRVALSSVVMIDPEAAPRQAGVGADAGAIRLAADTLGNGVLGEPAIRIFKPGARIVYACEVYDGRGEREGGFSTQATVLRDGKAIYTSPPAPIRGGDESAGPSGARPIGAVPVGGAVQLGRGMPPGVYTLQVSIAPRSGGRTRHASQWVDFEVR